MINIVGLLAGQHCSELHSLFIYALLIARGGTVKEEGQPEIARAKRYGVQQVVILIPLLVVVLSLIQESRREK